MTKKISNISLKVFRRYLEYEGCKLIRQKGGHEHWAKTELKRPITIQSHIDPVPEFIIKNALRILGKTKKDLINWLENK